MSTYLLVPDSFKGTMTSREVCRAMERGLRCVDANAVVYSIPVSDGGEGSVEAFLMALGGEKIEIKASGPFFDKIDAFYGILSDGETAVIEMAACAGLPLVYDRRDPGRTTTFGVGELILDAIERKCRRIIICLGGSATNDGGCGAAAAAGARFFDASGKVFVPTGCTLSEIAKIDTSALRERTKGVEFVTLCDVNNVLFGPSGAASIFAPQKGADEGQTALLDDGLRHLAEVEGHSLANTLGAGAAGGMGFGMLAFFSSKLRMGIDAMLDISGFDKRLEEADYVFTGEGRIDPQSMHGKVVIGVAKRAKRAGKPVIAVVGDISDGIEPAYTLGVTSIFSINRVAVEKSAARKRAPGDMALTVADVTRLIQGCKK